MTQRMLSSDRCQLGALADENRRSDTEKAHDADESTHADGREPCGSLPTPESPTDEEPQARTTDHLRNLTRDVNAGPELCSVEPSGAKDYPQNFDPHEQRIDEVQDGAYASGARHLIPPVSDSASSAQHRR